MKTLAIISALLFCSFTFVQDQNTTTKVYICTGSKSLKYHKSTSCYGLSKCSGTIKELTLEEAKKMGRTPCGICYKNN